jgi:hypothetical protein
MLARASVAGLSLSLLDGRMIPILWCNPLDLQAELDVLADRTVRKQGEMLEYHGDLGEPHLAQLLGIEPDHLLTVDLDAARRRLDQPVDPANQGRLPGP